MFIYLLCLYAALLCYTGFQNQSLISLIRSIFSPCSTCCFGLGFSTTKPTCRNTSKDLGHNSRTSFSKSTTASHKEINEAAERAEAALIRDLLTNNTNDDSSPELRECSSERRKSSQPDDSGRSASNESPCEVHEAPDSNHCSANPETSESSDQRMPTNNANDDSSPGSREGSPERRKTSHPDYSVCSASSQSSCEVHEAPDSNHSSASSDQRMPSLQSGSESSASSNAF